MNNKNVFWGVLAGLAAGTVLGILFAPAKGSETRQKISDTGNEFAENLKKRFDRAVDDLTGTSSATEGHNTPTDK
jgi:gas vesicle protein